MRSTEPTASPGAASPQDRIGQDAGRDARATIVHDNRFVYALFAAGATTGAGGSILLGWLGGVLLSAVVVGLGWVWLDARGDARFRVARGARGPIGVGLAATLSAAAFGPGAITSAIKPSNAASSSPVASCPPIASSTTVATTPPMPTAPTDNPTPAPPDAPGEPEMPRSFECSLDSRVCSPEGVTGQYTCDVAANVSNDAPVDVVFKDGGRAGTGWFMSKHASVKVTVSFSLQVDNKTRTLTAKYDGPDLTLSVTRPTCGATATPQLACASKPTCDGGKLGGGGYRVACSVSGAQPDVSVGFSSSYGNYDAAKRATDAKGAASYTSGVHGKPGDTMSVTAVVGGTTVTSSVSLGACP